LIIVVDSSASERRRQFFHLSVAYQQRGQVRPRPLYPEAAEERLRAADLEVTCVIEEEDPKHLLVKEAGAWQAASIFVGARELSRIGRLLLGSVSTAVVAPAPCSVEVVRPRLD
jgi:nucleotide-binding universal stress UspA family protein